MGLERSASVEEREKKRRRTMMKRAETINFGNQVIEAYIMMIRGCPTFLTCLRAPPFIPSLHLRAHITGGRPLTP